MSIFPTRILLATDGSEEATLATRTAVDLVEKTASELHVVHTEPIPVYADPSTERTSTLEDVEKNVRQEAQRLLDEQVGRIETNTPVQAHVRLGRPDEEIVVLADDLGAGLIVLGSRGLGGLRRALMGSVSDSVVRHAHCPVLVVRREKPRGEEEQEMFLT